MVNKQMLIESTFYEELLEKECLLHPFNLCRCSCIEEIERCWLWLKIHP